MDKLLFYDFYACKLLQSFIFFTTNYFKTPTNRCFGVQVVGPLIFCVDIKEDMAFGSVNFSWSTTPTTRHTEYLCHNISSFGHNVRQAQFALTCSTSSIKLLTNMRRISTGRAPCTLGVLVVVVNASGSESHCGRGTESAGWARAASSTSSSYRPNDNECDWAWVSPNTSNSNVWSLGIFLASTCYLWFSLCH